MKLMDALQKFVDRFKKSEKQRVSTHAKEKPELEKTLAGFIDGNATSILTEKEKLLSASDVSSLLSITVPTVLRLSRTGELPSFRIGKTWKYSRKQLEDWLLNSGRRKRIISGEPDETKLQHQ